MFQKKIKRVLVIGGRGFIGSHLLQAPLFDGENYIPTILDIKDGALGDVKSDTWLENEYDFIVFLACNFDESREGYTDNLLMTAQVAAYLETHQHTHLIFTSSAAVYQDAYRSMKEDDVHPLGAPSFYGQSKLISEMSLLAASYKVTVFRLSNVFGERGRGVVDLIKRGSRVIFGNGMQVRDYIHVDQVVSAITGAIQKPKRWRGIFNVSSGVGSTTLNIYSQFGKGSPDFQKARPKDVKFSVLDNTKFHERNV